MVTLVHEDRHETFHGFHLCQMYDIVEDPAHSVEVRNRRDGPGGFPPERGGDLSPV